MHPEVDGMRSLDAEKERIVDPGAFTAQEFLGLMKEPSNGSKKELAADLGRMSVSLRPRSTACKSLWTRCKRISMSP